MSMLLVSWYIPSIRHERTASTVHSLDVIRENHEIIKSSILKDVNHDKKNLLQCMPLQDEKQSLWFNWRANIITMCQLYTQNKKHEEGL